MYRLLSIISMIVVLTVLMFQSCSSEEDTNPYEDERVNPKIRFLHAAPNIGTVNVTLSIKTEVPERFSRNTFENEIVANIYDKEDSDYIKNFYYWKETTKEDFYQLKDNVTLNEKRKLLRILESIPKDIPTTFEKRVFDALILDKLNSDTNKNFLLTFYKEDGEYYTLTDNVSYKERLQILSIFESVSYYIGYYPFVEKAYFVNKTYNSLVEVSANTTFPEGDYSPLRIYQDNPTVLLSKIDQMTLVKGKLYTIILHGTLDNITANHPEISLVSNDIYKTPMKNKARISVFQTVPDLENVTMLEFILTKKSGEKDTMKIDNIGYATNKELLTEINEGTIQVGDLKLYTEINGNQTVIYQNTQNIILSSQKMYTFVFMGYNNTQIDSDNSEKGIILNILNNN